MEWRMAELSSEGGAESSRPCLKRKVLEEEDGERHLECPVCMDWPMVPPIRQCANGHTLCDACARSISQCPSCRTTPVNIRNLGMERLAAQFMVPCRHAPRCEQTVAYGQLLEHLALCDWRPTCCPAFNNPCAEEVRLPMHSQDLLSHLRQQHGLDAPVEMEVKGCEAKANWRVTNENGWRHHRWDGPLLHAFDSYFAGRFLAGVCDSSRCYSAWLQCLLPEGLCRRFRYVASVAACDRVYSFSGPVLSVAKPADEIAKAADCLRLPRWLAHRLSVNPEGSTVLDLTIQITILCQSAASG